MSKTNTFSIKNRIYLLYRKYFLFDNNNSLALLGKSNFEKNSYCYVNSNLAHRHCEGDSPKQSRKRDWIASLRSQ